MVKNTYNAINENLCMAYKFEKNKCNFVCIKNEP